MSLNFPPKDFRIMVKKKKSHNINHEVRLNVFFKRTAKTKVESLDIISLSL